MLKFFRENIKSFIVIIIILVVSVWGYIEIKHRRTSSDRALPQAVVTSVQAVAPKLQDIVVAHDYIGQVEAINSVDIVPYISGYIFQLSATGGQEVTQNTVLLTLRQDEYRAALMSTHADVLSARADLTKTRNQFERMQNAGPKAVSATEMDNARAAYLMAQAAVKQAEAAYFTAQINFGYTYLRAPFDGVLGNINASVGDFITPSSNTLMTLVQYNPIRVVFSITDKEYLDGRAKADLFADDKIKLVLPTGDLYAESGEVKYTSNVVDKTTNSIAVYAEFANPQHELVPNAYVKVLLERNYKDVVLLDKNRVQFKSDGNYVYTVDNQVLSLNKIDVLADYENSYVVVNTFKSNELIVTEEVDPRLLGQKVEIKPLSAEK